MPKGEETVKISQKGVDLIKAWEGIRDGDPSTVNLDPYLCPANVATIGWGHAITDEGKQLKGRAGLIRARELYPDGITLTQAEDLLWNDLRHFEQDVSWLLTRHDTPQNQFDALVSFAFNIGTDIDDDEIAEGLGDSTLLKKFNAGDILGAADEFLKWDKATVNGVKQRLRGLTNRRIAERKLFLS